MKYAVTPVAKSAAQAASTANVHGDIEAFAVAGLWFILCCVAVTVITTLWKKICEPALTTPAKNASLKIYGTAFRDAANRPNRPNPQRRFSMLFTHQQALDNSTAVNFAIHVDGLRKASCVYHDYSRDEVQAHSIQINLQDGIGRTQHVTIFVNSIEAANKIAEAFEMLQRTMPDESNGLKIHNDNDIDPPAFGELPAGIAAIIDSGREDNSDHNEIILTPDPKAA